MNESTDCGRWHLLKHQRSSQGKLIFNRYGNQYFLSELWFAGATPGNQLVKTETEVALLKERKRERFTIKITEAKPN